LYHEANNAYNTAFEKVNLPYCAAHSIRNRYKAIKTESVRCDYMEDKIDFETYGKALAQIDEELSNDEEYQAIEAEYSRLSELRIIFLRDHKRNNYHSKALMELE
jgi:hypothetical protein